MAELLDNFVGMIEEGPFAYKLSRDQPITEHFDEFDQLDGAQKAQVLQVRVGELNQCVVRVPGQEILVYYAPVKWFDGAAERGWGYKIRRRTVPGPSPRPPETAPDDATTISTLSPVTTPKTGPLQPARLSEPRVSEREPHPGNKQQDRRTDPAVPAQTPQEQIKTFSRLLLEQHTKVIAAEQRAEAAEQEAKAAKTRIVKISAEAEQANTAQRRAEGEMARLAKELLDARESLEKAQAEAKNAAQAPPPDDAETQKQVSLKLQAYEQAKNMARERINQANEQLEKLNAEKARLRADQAKLKEDQARLNEEKEQLRTAREKLNAVAVVPPKENESTEAKPEQKEKYWEPPSARHAEARHAIVRAMIIWLAIAALLAQCGFLVREIWGAS